MSTSSEMSPWSATGPRVPRHKLNLVQAVAVMAGVMVGSGIFISPVPILVQCASPALALLVWALSGLVMLLVALTYTELGAMYTEAGGEYAFFKHIIGDWAAFLFAWLMSVLVYPAFFALVSLISATYILMPFLDHCQALDTAIRLAAILIMVLLAFLNCAALRHVARVQTVLSASKFLALFCIIIIGIVQLSKGRTEILASGFDGSTRSPLAVAMGMYAGVFSYSGWQSLFALIEEVHEPHKNIPRCTFISFFVLITVYVMTNVAYLTVLSPEDMLQSEAVAMLFADKTLGKVSVIFPLVVACSTIGSLNGSIMGATRIYFAAARDGLFPRLVALTSSDHGAPVPAVILTTTMTVLYTVLGNAMVLLEYLGFTALAAGCVSAICAIYLRYHAPHRHRPVQFPVAVHVTAACSTLMLLILGFCDAPTTHVIGILLVVSGLPVYWFTSRMKKSRTLLQKRTEKITTNLQKVLLLTPEEKVH